ncbi:hypothetical protein Bca4012_065727 [Brassica carinata]
MAALLSSQSCCYGTSPTGSVLRQSETPSKPGSNGRSVKMVPASEVVKRKDAANIRLPPIACSRGTDQEDNVFSSSEKESRDLLPHKDGLRDTLQDETYKTSFKTVSLCVSIFLHLLVPSFSI